MTAELAIDGRWLKTGIGRYTRALLAGVRGHLQGTRVTCIAHPKDAASVSPFVDEVTQCKAGIYGLREQMALPRLTGKADALYVPHYNIPLLRRGRMIVTIHDVNHLVDRGYRRTLRSRLYARPMLRRAVEGADVIITPSRYTMLRLSERFRVDPARVWVIPCCVAPCFRQCDKSLARERVARTTGISQPFLLFVGGPTPNKNLTLLLEAMHLLLQRRKDAPMLLVVGKQARGMKPLRLQNVGWFSAPADEDLADLYAAALMTVMPSFEEGFGLPVIESMACGTPVLCSRAASLPEVGGEAALYFSPYSSEELAATIENLMDSNALQESLIRAGLARAMGFSPQDFWRRQATAIRTVLPNQN